MPAWNFQERLMIKISKAEFFKIWAASVVGALWLSLMELLRRKPKQGRWRRQKRHQTERKEDAVYHDSFDMADTGLEFPIVKTSAKILFGPAFFSLEFNAPLPISMQYWKCRD